MVAGIGVQAKAIVIMTPGCTWTGILAGLTVAVRNALMHTALSVDGQARV
jgi:hypothetical protein